VWIVRRPLADGDRLVFPGHQHADPERADRRPVELDVDALFYLPIEWFRDKVLKGLPACMACATGQRAVKFEYSGKVLPKE